jgi:F-type H+-transporting ATPase subunit beta
MMFSPRIIGQHHYQVAREVRKTLATYEDLKDIIAMLGIEELSEQDRNIVLRARRLQRYLSQPFWVTAAHTGVAGVSVPLAATLDDCDGFLTGRYDELGEDQCYMRGSMRESAS